MLRKTSARSADDEEAAAASMRPQRNAAENRHPAIRRNMGFSSFNEAAA